MEDKQTISFADSDTMISFVNEKENSSQWITDIPIAECQFFGIEDVSSLPSDASDATLSTVLNGTKLFIEVPFVDKPLPIRDCAMQSIYDRVRARCGYVSALPPVRKAEVLTEAAEYINVSCRGGNSKEKVESKKEGKKGILSVVDGKVSCFLSGNGTSNDYVHHSSSELLLNARDVVDSIGGVQSFKGFYSYTGLDASWLTTKKVEIEESDPFESFYIELHVSTSDVGLGAINIQGRLSNGIDTLIPIGGKQKVLHRRNTNVTDVIEALDTIDKCIDATKKDMENLKLTIVDYPIPCMQRVIRELELPIKTSLEILESYKVAYGTKAANAYTLYLVLCQILGKLESIEPEAFSYRNSQERNVLKALSPKIWEKNDYPETV